MKSTQMYGGQLQFKASVGENTMLHSLTMPRAGPSWRTCVPRTKHSRHTRLMLRGRTHSEMFASNISDPIAAGNSRVISSLISFESKGQSDVLQRPTRRNTTALQSPLTAAL